MCGPAAAVAGGPLIPYLVVHTEYICLLIYIPFVIFAHFPVSLLRIKHPGSLFF